MNGLSSTKNCLTARFTMRGTHDGTFYGVPATGKKIEVRAMNFYRLRGGQFVEEYGRPDLLEILQQIGAIPRGYARKFP